MLEVPGEDRSELEAIVRADLGGGLTGTERVAATVELFGEPLDEGKVAAALASSHPALGVRPEDVFLCVRRRPDQAFPLSATWAAVVSAADGAPAGYVVQTYRHGESSALEHYLDYFVMNIDDPRTRGMADALLPRMEALAEKLGAGRCALKTAWLGRLRWALDGYDFSTEKEREKFRAGFRAFLTHFQIPESELYFDRGDGTTQPFSWKGLHHAWDFAHVRSKARTVELPTYLGVDRVEVQRLDVGRAFLLGDPNDAKLKKFVFKNWEGVRPHDPDSPGQRQRARYQAIRAAGSRP
jgi:hypothetical protein